MIRLPVNRAQIKQELIAIAKAVLHKDTLKPRQSLFEQGLTSVGALDIRARLENRFQIPLLSSTLFDYPTLAALETFLTEHFQSRGAKLAAAPPTSPGSSALGDAMVREILRKKFGV